MDEILDWAKQYLEVNSRLPGRRSIMQRWHLGENQARKLAARLRAELLPPPLPGRDYQVVPVQETPIQPEDLWQMQASISSKHLKARRSTMYRHVHFDGSMPIAVCFPADLHLGSQFTDHDRILEDQLMIGTTPGVYQVNGGDLFDNAIRHQGHVNRADSTPEREVQLLHHLLSVAGDKYLAVVSGNHDDWTMEVSGVDVLEQLFHTRSVIYSRSRLLLTIHLGDVEYRVLVTHKYRYNSGLNQLHAVQRMLERGMDEFDVGVVGHNHEAAVGTFTWRLKPRVAIRPGSYQIGSEWSTRHGFNDSLPSCPMVIFRHDRHEMLVFDDIRKGMGVFDGLNQYRSSLDRNGAERSRGTGKGRGGQPAQDHRVPPDDDPGGDE